MTAPEVTVDARGVPITVGATCVYGGPVGRSIAMVEGTVEGFTQSGRVNVRVVRRAYGWGGKEVVHVGADRLVIVAELPPSPLRTQAEKTAAYEAQSEQYRATGVWPTAEQ